MERFNFVLLVAGFGFFALSFVIMGVLPIEQYRGIDIVTIEQLAQDVPYQFTQLAEDFPDEFEAAYGTKDATPEAFAQAIQSGKKVYIAEACWHCHTQQIRRVDPNNDLEVGHDISRFSPKNPYESVSDEYFNEMNYPPVFGTRRVGPDLFAESGKHPNDWHMSHFWNPRLTSPYSVMPPYKWFFNDKEGLSPNEKGLSIIAYMQWLGSWRTQFAPTTITNLPDIPFDESWYPAVESLPDEGDTGDEGDDYGSDEEDY